MEEDFILSGVGHRISHLLRIRHGCGHNLHQGLDGHGLIRWVRYRFAGGYEITQNKSHARGPKCTLSRPKFDNESDAVPLASGLGHEITWRKSTDTMCTKQWEAAIVWSCLVMRHINHGCCAALFRCLDRSGGVLSFVQSCLQSAKCSHSTGRSPDKCPGNWRFGESVANATRHSSGKPCGVSGKLVFPGIGSFLIWYFIIL